ncbi:hypothetical protein B0A49_03706 [Cryomyces minteri]|uniref:RRM domain-containing protein n=1 Tax=Cryomyces minteri TaxID=331657 RepID=A0A4U0XK86_9PEZI|nr:hypothetical protein B0A49_03706 [Cryomyces minteri]
MATATSQRQNNFGNPALEHTNRGGLHGQYTPRGPSGQMYARAPQAVMQHGHGDLNMAALSQGFGGMSLQHPSYATQVAKGGVPMSAQSSEYGGGPLGQAMPTAVWYDGRVMFTGQHQGGQHYNGIQQPDGVYTPIAGHYMPQANYQAYQHHSDHSPISQGWTSRNVSGDMPTLVTPRRDSISSNENEGAPGTPSFSYNGYQQGVAVIDRSPNGVYTHSTPSPSQMVGAYGMPQVGKLSPLNNVPLSLQLRVQMNPPIPRAIPAPSSPVKPLDRSLENQNGETNVYIRGLLPETTDEMLEIWAARFGDIKSSKSIIDHNTGLCKGFGFVKYHNFADAEACIRGFHYLGYEVSFAKESFYSKLKKFADESNTNLYVSNLPREFNEHELSVIFSPHKVCSSRILRDNNGNGRGVGFARFESRSVCEDVIRNFNNTPVRKQDGDEHLIQIRYADTEQQKWLKQQTAASRQFRAAEYEYATQAHRWGHGSRLPELTASEHEAANDFETFLGSSARPATQGGSRWAQSALPRQMPVHATTAIPFPQMKSQPAVRTDLPPKATIENDSSESEADAKTKATSSTPAVVHGDSGASASSPSAQDDE